MTVDKNIKKQQHNVYFCTVHDLFFTLLHLQNLGKNKWSDSCVTVLVKVAFRLQMNRKKYKFFCWVQVQPVDWTIKVLDTSSPKIVKFIWMYATHKNVKSNQITEGLKVKDWVAKMLLSAYSMVVGSQVQIQARSNNNVLPNKIHRDERHDFLSLHWSSSSS